MTVAVETLLTVVNNPVQDGEYAYTVDSWDPAHIRVRLTGGAAGDVTLTQGPDYTVAPGGRASARTVTLLADPDGATQMLIDRQTVVAQESSFVQTASGFEAALDRLTMSVQERLGEFGESVLAPIGMGGLRLPAPVANRGIGWDAAGAALTLTEPGASVEVGVNGAITQGAGGTGATSLAAATLVADGGDVARALGLKLGETLSSEDVGDIDDLAAAAFVQNSAVRVAAGETVYLDCDPTGGDSLAAMMRWMAWEAHEIAETAVFELRLADGVHQLNTSVDITDGRRVIVRGRITPAQAQIVPTISIASAGGNLYDATLRVADPLPAHVVTGMVIGVQNPQGNNGAASVAGAHIVTFVAGDRLSLGIRYLSTGVTPTSAGTLDNTADPVTGLTPNQLVLPYCTLVMDFAGWDGSAREGALNALRGGSIQFKYLAIAYDGDAGTEHDLVFAGQGGEIDCFDYVLLCGAGDKVARAGQRGHLRFNRSFLGGVCQEAVQLLLGTGEFTRTTFSGGTTSGVTLGAGSVAFCTGCTFTGSPILARTVDATAFFAVFTSKMRNGALAGQASGGKLSFNSITSIERCGTPLGISVAGDIYGAPAIAVDPAAEKNTNAPIQAGVLINGGMWQTGVLRTHASLVYSGTTTWDAPSIAAGACANASTVAVPGALIGDRVTVYREDAFATQGIAYEGACLADGVITPRACNYSPGAIDVGLVTLRIDVERVK